MTTMVTMTPKVTNESNHSFQPCTNADRVMLHTLKQKKKQNLQQLKVLRSWISSLSLSMFTRRVLFADNVQRVCT